MRGHPVLLLCAVAMMVTIAAGCSSAAPAATPTKAAASAASTSAPAAAAAPTKASEPAKAGEPTKPAAAAAKTDFPLKGKTITYIVPFAAGGSTDVAARLLAPIMEADLGVQVQVVNKPGATTQTAIAEFVNAKPDGYTVLSVSVPTSVITYVDSSRKANYSAKSFAPIGVAYGDTVGIAVPADHPFKTFQDFISAAKTKTLKLAITGLLGSSHLTMYSLGQETGTKYGYADFDSGSAAVTAVLGGHVDAAAVGPGNMANLVRQGKLRVLAMVDARPSHELFPGVPTTSSMGYKTDAQSYHTLCAPAGTPPEVVARLQASLKKAAASEEFKTKLNAAGMDVKSLDGAEATKVWAGKEEWVRSIFEAAKAEIGTSTKQ